MKSIGEISNISYNGLWLIRSEIAPRVGSNVFNQQKQKVGRIINIIGPVSRPYILVRPAAKKKELQLQLIGEKLYIMEEAKGTKQVNGRKKSRR